MGFEILLTVLAEESRTETDYDEHGVKTIVEYRTDEQGRRVKVGWAYTVVVHADCVLGYTADQEDSGDGEGA